MDDLISRQAAIDALGGEPMEYTEYEQGLHDKWIDAKQNIEALPSAEPEIIRCRDCEHWEREKLGGNELRHGTCYSITELFNCINGNTYNVDDFQTGENFYCGFAYRGEGENNA